MEKKAQPVLCHCRANDNLFDQKGLFLISKYACGIIQTANNLLNVVGVTLTRNPHKLTNSVGWIGPSVIRRLWSLHRRMTLRLSDLRCVRR